MRFRSGGALKEFALLLSVLLLLGCGRNGTQSPSAASPQTPSSVSPQNWWSADYAKARQILVSGGSAGVAVGAVASVAVDTRALITGSLLRPDRNDLRLVYNDNEIDRVLTDTGTILFKVQAPVAAAGSDGNYYLYYGNPNELAVPMSSKGNVYPFYVDGSSTEAFYVTGPAPVVTAMPKPEFLKFSDNPVLRRTANSGDWKNVRDLNTLWYEDGWYYVFYDADDAGTIDGVAGWGTYLAKSRDLSNWTKLGPVLQPGSSGLDSGSASGAYVNKFGSTYYMYYLGTPNILLGVPADPYVGMLATATSISGPYIKQGVVLPLGAGGSFDEAVTLINSVWNDGITYKALYSATGLGYADSSDPSGPWNNRACVLPGSEGVENPVLIFDSSSGHYYLFANNVQQQSYGYQWRYTDSIVMYWSTDPASWNVANKTTVISPGYGAWDGYVIGLMSSIVRGDGVIYAAYDGRAQPPEEELVWGHEFRDGAMVEAKFPFAWGSRINVANGTTLLSKQTFGDGILKVTARMAGSNTTRVGLSDGTPDWYAKMLFQVDGGGSFSINNKSYKIVGGFDRVKGQTKTFEIRRSGATASYIFDGVPIVTTTGPTGNMPIYIAGDVAIESITFQSATPAPAVAGSEIGPPP